MKTLAGMGVVFPLAYGVIGIAAAAHAATVRVEAELMPVYYWDVNDQNLVASPSYDAAASGHWCMDCRLGWTFIENIVAPAAGTYGFTFRLRAVAAGNLTNCYVRSDEFQGYPAALENSFGGASQDTWYDYGVSLELGGGANTIEIGGWPDANFKIDYIEFDNAGGLRFEAPIKHWPLRIEAETAVLGGNAFALGDDGSGKNVAVVETGTGTSGDEYLAFHGAAGTPATATLTVNIPTGQLGYAYYVRYAARHAAYPVGAVTTEFPDGVGAGQCDELLVNGEVVARTQIPYNDANWHEMVMAELLDSYLVEGDNTIQIRSTWSHILYDYIEIEGLGTGVPEGDITASGPVWDGENIVLMAPATTSSRPDFGWNYQWMLNGTALSDGGNVSGTTERSLAFTGIGPDNEGVYTVNYVHAETDPLVSKPFAIADVVPESAMPSVGFAGLGLLGGAVAGSYWRMAKRRK